MKVLLIGGTGRISTAVTAELVGKGRQVYVLNRGDKNKKLPGSVTRLIANINDEPTVIKLLQNMSFDVIVDFIAYEKANLQRDFRLFKSKTKQFIFISSASVYKKTLDNYYLNENTPAGNPYWEYSRNKIECEKYLNDIFKMYEFPATVIRPSHTYDEYTLPVGLHGANGSWQVAKRIIDGKPVIIHGDGTSLWTITHSSDFAKGLVGLMGDTRAIGETFQITSDEALTWNDIYSELAKALGRELKAVHIASDFLIKASGGLQGGKLLGDKANSMIFDNSKLKALVPDFKATKKFSQGIRETVDNLLSNPVYQKEDPEFDRWCDRVIDIYCDALKKFSN